MGEVLAQRDRNLSDLRVTTELLDELSVTMDALEEEIAVLEVHEENLENAPPTPPPRNI